ncbi:hypothetical protein ELI03_34670 [Rhizobium leguminosarum]|uniref:Uncharacterized protein n=1 Tax=Rhizobium leguminosarum TaxID=384 RepID=A0A4Q8XPH5_RHILE|nr:hypothetical protein [Rhizobium leguminosarum]TAX64402.1 hypothetical protein ELI03_34670 [Rhizobium leguminosarum]
MENVASDEVTLKLNIEDLEARLRSPALADSTVLRPKLERELFVMMERLDELIFPKLGYDPKQQPSDDSV